MNRRYAVLFKVHYWDAFVERRLRHLCQKVATGDVYVFVDETHGTVGHIPHDRVIRATERSCEKLGVPLHPAGKLFWYNADYPLYLLFLEDRSYDFYVMCEYDVVFNVAVDQFVNVAQNDRIDYVGSALADSFQDWIWASTCDGVYDSGLRLYNWLNAIALFSNRSVQFLLQRRRALAVLYGEGKISSWPYSEVFIATEMHNSGFVVRELGEFGKVDNYSWWPPTHERDLPLLQEQDFLHPVLDERRYVASCLRYGSLHSYLLPNGKLRRLLQRSTKSHWSFMPAFLSEIARRIRLRLPGSHGRDF